MEAALLIVLLFLVPVALGIGLAKFHNANNEIYLLTGDIHRLKNFGGFPGNVQLSFIAEKYLKKYIENDKENWFGFFG